MQRKKLGSSLALIVALALGTGLGSTPATAHQLPATVSIPMATVKLAKVTTVNLNLRKSTTTASKLLVTIPKNTSLTITRTSGSWSYTTYKGMSGWAHGSYLKNAPTKAKATYLYATATATLRSTASDKGKSLGTVARRTKVARLGTSGAWTKVKSGSSTGYIKTTGLSTKLPAKAYRWATADTTVRSSPNASAKKLYVLKRGQQVEWLQNTGSWQLITTTQGRAWAPGSTLATKKPDPLPPVVTKPKPPVTAKPPVATPSKPPVTAKPPVATPSKPPVTAKPNHRWTTANVNLRPTSSTKGAPLGLVPRGEKVTVVKSTDGWSNAKTSQGTGWMSSDYLATAAVPADPKPEDPQEAKETYRWTTSDVNLRSDGSTDNPSLGVVPEGEKVGFLGSENGWANVKTSEATGWISEAYLSAKEIVPKPATPPPASDAQYRWATADVNLRPDGSTGKPPLGVVQTGEKVTFIMSVNGWVNVKTSAGTGWISEAYLSKTLFTASPGLKPNAVKVKNLIVQLYPYEVYSIGGVRQGSVGHSAGVALDLMIRDYKKPSGIKAGDAIAAYLLENRTELGIDYLIWRDQIWLSRKGWVPYSKGGYGQHLGTWNDTTLHYDHIHVETLGR
ncbi:SH3 domain-containing protein [Paeniglutamicibacter cryotolerans]|uniref:Uncharacterized protein YgiM (DUF1202 family) n=1 Tax=Paeniglutamicibacter cryotolerans TaxID=670079 RepID=A0A839QQM2_9MICC|nr:SH3 domain-containing protein [Paeniglutamicibacter cryotolerans]MBB2997074.1 uncharacterized protein YgiM (DUF1202 family) [Paeniglutamicibacter cryotolerans]